MEAELQQQTVVPTDRTFEDVLAAGAGELNQDTFALAAQAAETSANEQSDLDHKSMTFNTQVVANCEKLGHSIPQRCVLVASSMKPTFFAPAGFQFWYNHRGSDNVSYYAYVYA